MNMVSPRAVGIHSLFSGAMPINRLLRTYLSDGREITRSEEIVELFTIVHQLNEALKDANSKEDRKSWEQFLSKEVYGLRFTPFSNHFRRSETASPVRSTQLDISHLAYLADCLKGIIDRQELSSLMTSGRYTAVVATQGNETLSVCLGKRIEIQRHSILYFHINVTHFRKRYTTLNEMLGPHEGRWNDEGVDGIVFLDKIKPFSAFNHYASDDYTLIDSRSKQRGRCYLGLFFKSISNRELPVELVKECFDRQRASQEAPRTEGQRKALL